MTRCTFGIHKYPKAWETDPDKVYFVIRRGVEITYELLVRRCELCGHQSSAQGDTALSIRRVR